MRQITIEGMVFPSANEAIQHTNASGLGVAITLDGKGLVVSEAEAQRLEAAHIQFAYLNDNHGRTVTVPTNGSLRVRLKDPDKQ